MSKPGQYRTVASPLTAEALTPLPEDCPGIVVNQPMRDDEYRQLAELLERQPDKKLYALQVDSTRQEHITTIDFLKFFPRLRRFTCNLAFLRSLQGVEHLRHADSLSLFKSPNRMSAAPLAELTNLKELWLDGHFTDRGALRGLSGLTNFSMGYAGKVADLSFLPPNLTRFSMNLGSITDISALADLPHLQRLSFHKVHSLADLSPLADATALAYLYLVYLNKVTELFDMSALTELTELIIGALTNLAELRQVLTAPSLTTLSVHEVPNLDHQSWRETCQGWLAQGKPPFWE
jgi:hypothetical protein